MCLGGCGGGGGQKGVAVPPVTFEFYAVTLQGSFKRCILASKSKKLKLMLMQLVYFLYFLCCLLGFWKVLVDSKISLKVLVALLHSLIDSCDKVGTCTAVTLQ